MLIAVVVPFLNEERHLSGLLRSVAGQSRRPDRLVLVDDGSSDGSLAVATEFAEPRPWVTVRQRPARRFEGDRLAAANELHAFEWAVGQLGLDWDVAGKLDGDLELSPDFLAHLEHQFQKDHRLGVAGTFLQEEDHTGTLVRLRIRSEHVHGATKFYRRECYEEIAPLPGYLGWDMIDEVRARMRGWRTQSFAVPGGDPLHARPRGSYDGKLRAFRRWGMGAWATGEHPLHVILHGVVRLRERPLLLGGVNYVAGWAFAGLRGFPRAERDLRAHVRREQLGRIRLRIRRALQTAPSPARRA